MNLRAALNGPTIKVDRLRSHRRIATGRRSNRRRSKELPRTHDEAVSVLADMAKELCDEVEKTPRRVVSASIINQANKLIALIQFVRGARD